MAKQILQDHTRKGKVFTPPMLTLGTSVETAWLDYAVPELIWSALLIDYFGITRVGALRSQ
jgi:hypothetical protein